jgi:peptidyl-prolyl cis-trans isomerase D
MVKEFNDFVFNKPVGSRDTVKTQFGYHVIEVLGQKGSQMNYKIAYMAKQIVPSDETDNAVSNAASRFAGESKNAESFNDNFNKILKAKGVNKLVAEDIKPGDFNITGLGLSRSLVKNIFEADKGDVLQPERIGDAYVVAAVTEVYPAGMQSVSRARAVVEPVLRNKKKAEQIKAKFGKITTLEAASAAVGQPIQLADSLRFNGNNPTLSFESKVVGASFNPANKGKVVPEAIEGQSGVYVLRVENISAVAVMAGTIEQQRQAMQMQARQAASGINPVEALKKTADIKDNRNKFY